MTPEEAKVTLKQPLRVAPRCSICGGEPFYEVLEILDADGESTLALQYDPHTCPISLLEEICTSDGEVIADEITELKSRASSIGIPA